MRPHHLAVAALAATLLVSGCAHYSARYDLILVPTASVKVGPKDTYDDPSFHIVWKPSVHGLHFVLVNRSQHSLQIIWNDAAYVDPGGNSHRVFHSGIRIVKRNASEPPTVVHAGARVQEYVFPSDYVAWVDTNTVEGWGAVPLLPVRADDPSELERYAQEFTGKTMDLVLPITIGGKERNYRFRFLVKTVWDAQKHVKLAPTAWPEDSTPVGPASSPTDDASSQ